MVPARDLPESRVGTERLGREDRLRRRTEFLRCYRQGRRRNGAFCQLYSLPNEVTRPRLGITASRKVGSAVIRQRLRRRVREIYRRWPGRGSLPALDLVVHLRPSAAAAEFPALRRELVGLFGSLERRR